MQNLNTTITTVHTPAVRATMGPTITNNSVGGVDTIDDDGSTNHSNWKWFIIGAGISILAAAGGYYLYQSSKPSSKKGGNNAASDDTKKQSKKDSANKTTKSQSSSKDAASEKQKDSKSKMTKKESIDASTPTPQPDDSTKPISEMTHQERIDRANYLKQRGNKFYTAKRYETAIEVYTEALEVYPDQDETLAIFYSNRAACYAQLNQEEKVLENCNAALKIHPKYVKALFRRGQAFEKLEKYWESLLDYTTACIIENFGKNESMMAVDRVLKLISKVEAVEKFKIRGHVFPSVSFISAYLDSFREQPGFKLSYAEIASENGDSNDGDADFKHAVSCIKSHEYTKALESLEKAISKGTQTYMTEAKLWRGTFYYLQARLAEAQKDLTEVIQTPGVPAELKVNALIKRANVTLELIAPNFDQMDKVMADFEEAIKTNDKDSDIYYHRGQLHFLTGDLYAAVADYKKSVELCNTVPFAYVQLAVGYYRANSVQQSIDTFKEALEKFPNVAEVNNYYGEILLDKRDFAEANKRFDTAIKLDPTNPLSYINKALALFQENQDIEGAINLTKKAIEVDEHCDVAYAHLAQMHLQQGNLQGAVENYETATNYARTEADMANMISCRDFARAQLEVSKMYPDIKIPSIGAPVQP